MESWGSTQFQRIESIHKEFWSMRHIIQVAYGFLGQVEGDIVLPENESI